MSRITDAVLYAELRLILKGKLNKTITIAHEKALKRIHERFLRE